MRSKMPADPRVYKFALKEGCVAVTGPNQIAHGRIEHNKPYIYDICKMNTES